MRTAFLSSFSAKAGLLALTLLVFVNLRPALAQVGVGTTSPNTKAALDIQSSANDKGILIPRLTQTQRRAILNPPQGLLVFQTGTATVAAGLGGLLVRHGGGGGSGVGKWLYLPDKSASGDNLGNHTATQNLNLADKLLVGGTAASPGTTGLSILSSGNVGIGTTNPAALLDVSGATNTTSLTIDNGNTNGGSVFGAALRFGGTGTGEGVSSARTGSTYLYGLDFYTGYANRLSIKSNGQGAFTLAVTGGGSAYDDTTNTTFSGSNAFPAATRLTIQSDGTGWIVVSR